MTAFVYDANGTGWQLPALLRWDVSHGFCSPCDSFEVEFIYAPEMLDALRAACRFRGEWEGETVFFGVVDEFELSAGEGGCTCTLLGRGMQALLLDSQAESADYYDADTDFVLRRHVYACGVTGADAGAYAASRATLSVSAGESHWSVVKNFAEFCLGLRPRFSAEGILLLDGDDSGRVFNVSGRTPVTAQSYAQERYGVISRVLVKNRTKGGTTVTVENEAFQAIGGNCVRIVSVPRKTAYDAMRHTGSYQIAKSREDSLRCRLTVPQCFAAFPGDRAVLLETPLGISGTFKVLASRCFANGSGAGTVLELRQA